MPPFLLLYKKPGNLQTNKKPKVEIIYYCLSLSTTTNLYEAAHSLPNFIRELAKHTV